MYQMLCGDYKKPLPNLNFVDFAMRAYYNYYYYNYLETPDWANIQIKIQDFFQICGADLSRDPIIDCLLTFLNTFLD